MLNTGLSLQRIAVKGGKRFTPAALFQNSEYGGYWTARDFKEGFRNLHTHTDHYDQWAVSNMTRTTGQADADGGTQAISLTQNNGTTANHYIFQQAQGFLNKQHHSLMTLSFFVKGNGADGFAFFYSVNGTSVFKYAYVQNLDSTPTFNTGTTTDGLNDYDNLVASSITDEGNGWYRISITYRHTNNQNAHATGIFLTSGSGASQSINYTASNGTDGIFLYNSQLEEGTLTSPEGINNNTVTIAAGNRINSNYKRISTGTSSAVYYGQEVHRWLSKNGNTTHALIEGGGNSLKMAIKPSRGVVNLVNPTFVSSVGGTTDHGAGYADDHSTHLAYKFNLGSSGDTYVSSPTTNVAVTSGDYYNYSVYVKNETGADLYFKAYQGTVNVVSATISSSTGWQRVNVTRLFTNSNNYDLHFRVGSTSSNGGTFYVSHPQIEKSNTATAVQVKHNAFKVLEGGTGINQILFDGTNGYSTTLNLQTNNVDEFLTSFGASTTEDGGYTQHLCEHSAYSDYGSGRFKYLVNSSTNLFSRVAFSSSSIGGTTTLDYDANRNNVATLYANADTGDVISKLSDDQESETTDTNASSTGVFVNETWHVGCRGTTSPANEWRGAMMEVLFRGGATTAEERLNAHNYIKGKI